jgi:hypothetical protein
MPDRQDGSSGKAKNVFDAVRVIEGCPVVLVVLGPFGRFAGELAGEDALFVLSPQ